MRQDINCVFTSKSNTDKLCEEILKKIKHTTSEIKSAINNLNLLTLEDKLFNSYKTEIHLPKQKSLRRLSKINRLMSIINIRRRSSIAKYDPFHFNSQVNSLKNIKIKTISTSPKSEYKRPKVNKRKKPNLFISTNTQYQNFSTNSQNIKNEPKKTEGLYITSFDEIKDKSDSKLKLNKNKPFITYSYILNPKSSTNYLKSLENTKLFYPNKISRNIRLVKKNVSQSIHTTDDIIKKFHHSKYKSLCQEFDKKVKKNKAIKDHLLRTYHFKKNPKTPKIFLPEEKSFDYKEFKSNSLSKVYNKKSGMLSIMNKENANIIHFWDNLNKFNDISFYNRAREFIYQYKGMTKKDHLNINSKNVEDINAAIREKIRSNSYILLKKYSMVRRDHLRVTKTLNNFFNHKH